MANSALCVACAQLIQKEASAAARSQRCPECRSPIGVTSYGAPFRMLPAKRKLLSVTFCTALALGGTLTAFVVLMIGLSLWTTEQTAHSGRPAHSAPPENLTHVPEVAVQDAFPGNIRPHEAKHSLTTLIAKIRTANAAKQDGFMLAQIDRRKELRGLPFVMGDACRIDPQRAQSFQTSVEAVRDSMDTDSHARSAAQDHHAMFWTQYAARTGNNGTSSDPGIAALTQILGPAPKTLRVSLVEKLAQSQNVQATKVLAKAAIFDASGEVRSAAIAALKDRPKQDYSDVLMHGIRYPIASVAKRSAIAMILLDRKDLLPELTTFLGEPAPGDPAEEVVGEKKVCTVREVVRINHHRNCLLCHAPTETGSTHEVPGVIPIPGTPFPESPKDAYGSAQSTGDPMVRADTTYLRQDFSMMMPVANAAPWPEMQRFDFLVRTRVVEGKELEALQRKVQERPVDDLSENHKAAVRVLRELTGQDAAPNQAAWQQVVGVK